MKLQNGIEVPKLVDVVWHMTHYENWIGFAKKPSDLYGRCDQSARILIKLMFGGSYPNHTHPAYRRGWFTDVELVSTPGWIRNNAGHIRHSWIEVDGWIVDPTWWAFYDKRPSVGVFKASDARYVPDSNNYW